MLQVVCNLFGAQALIGVLVLGHLHHQHTFWRLHWGKQGEESSFHLAIWEATIVLIQMRTRRIPSTRIKFPSSSWLTLLLGLLCEKFLRVSVTRLNQLAIYTYRLISIDPTWRKAKLQRKLNQRLPRCSARTQHEAAASCFLSVHGSLLDSS
jgi:hypothetical protein